MIWEAFISHFSKYIIIAVMALWIGYSMGKGNQPMPEVIERYVNSFSAVANKPLDLPPVARYVFIHRTDTIRTEARVIEVPVYIDRPRIIASDKMTFDPKSNRVYIKYFDTADKLYKMDGFTVPEQKFRYSIDAYIGSQLWTDSFVTGLRADMIYRQFGMFADYNYNMNFGVHSALVGFKYNLTRR